MVIKDKKIPIPNASSDSSSIKHIKCTNFPLQFKHEHASIPGFKTRIHGSIHCKTSDYQHLNISHPHQSLEETLAVKIKYSAKTLEGKIYVSWEKQAVK